MFKVVTLYKFTPLDQIEIWKQKLLSLCKDLTGTLLIAPEGINGTIAGMPSSIDEVMAQLTAMPVLHDLWYQYAETQKKPFRKLKIRIKKEIVTMAKAEAEPLKKSGYHVLATEWNATLAQAAVVIDVRNNYEYRLGTFQGAINPKTVYFSEFPKFVTENLMAYKDKPVAMFCTGGIRCEKASAYMLAHGFKEIYQLNGGILQYLAHVPAEDTKWQGECFVFDERVSLGHGLAQGKSILCYGCRMPLTTEDVKEHYKPGVRCTYCASSKSLHP